VAGKMPEPFSVEYKIKFLSLPSYLLHNLTFTPFEAIKEHRQQFFQRLEEDIKKNGILNPVLVEAGRVRKGNRHRMNKYQTKNEQCLFFVTGLGGSRTWVAHKLGILVPCVISDFRDLLEAPEISKKDAEKLFPDLPEGRCLMHDREGLKGPAWLNHRHLPDGKI
jgi:hypothetical protein